MKKMLFAMLLVALFSTVQADPVALLYPSPDPDTSNVPCETIGKNFTTYGYYENKSCVSQQRCTLWAREFCDGGRAWVSYEYDNLGSCLWHCSFPDGSYLYGLSIHVLPW